MTYSAYGSRSDPSRARSAYAGQVLEVGTGWHLLGQRPYSPLMRRFLAPDALSPFGQGGLNRYAYCGGDPINYVDPSGNMPHSRRPWLNHWRPWDDSSRFPTVSANTPANPSLNNASGAFLTPTIATTSEVARIDITAIPANLPSNSLVTRRVSGGEVLWSMAPDTARSSTGATMAPPMRQRIAQRRHGATSSVRQIDVLSGRDAIHQSRWGTDRWTGEGLALKQSWIGRSPPGRSEITIWAAETVVNTIMLRKLFGQLKSLGVERLTLYIGAHGNWAGKHWNQATGERLGPAPFALLEAFRFAPDDAAFHGIQLDEIVDLHSLTKEQLESRLSRPRHHVVYSCFSAADEVVMRQLGLSYRVTYHDRTQAI